MSEMIDDQYWLKFAKDNTDKVFDRINDGANKLDTFLTWVWGLYTASFAATLIFNQVTESTLLRCVMALPIIFIPLSKFLCIRVQMPVFVSYYPNIPDSIINDYYGRVVKTKRKMFRWAVIISIIGIALISVSLFMYRIGPSETFFVKFNHIESSHILIINGNISKNAGADLNIFGKIDTSSYKIVNLKIKANNDGAFDTTIADQRLKTDIKVYCKWNLENGQTRIIDK